MSFMKHLKTAQAFDSPNCMAVGTKCLYLVVKAAFHLSSFFMQILSQPRGEHISKCPWGFEITLKGRNGTK
jgi:hypothetical protein